MTQTPAVMTDPVGVPPEKAYKGYIKPTTSWSSPNPGSTRRSRNGQSKKPRRQIEFKAMRMHCPGDENIIPLYRPEDSTEDSEFLMPRKIRHNDQFTSTTDSAAASKQKNQLNTEQDYDEKKMSVNTSL
jgi:hypothetical protein